MAKRSKRRVVRYDKEQAGCMWGLISMFDFRHGRTTRKLLADRRLGIRNSVVAASTTTKLSMLTNSNEMIQGIENDEENEKLALDVGKTSVKELMEEEMFSEQGSKKDVNITEIEWIDTAQVGHVKKNHSRSNKAFKRSFDSQNNLDLEGIMEELSQIHQKSTSCVKHESKDGSEQQSDQTYSAFEEKLTAAIMVFMNERFANDKILTGNKKTHHSKEFMDALQILSSNKELFLKLLQDPNSLLVKHIQGSETARLQEDRKTQSLAGPTLLDDEPSSSRPDDNITRKHRNFFRRKNKYQENNHLKGKDNDNSQVASRIVILKPGLPETGENAIASTSLQSRYKMENQAGSGNSQFSFTEIKRKLKHAIGKETHEITPHTVAYKNRNLTDIEKGVGEGSGGWSSPNRNHFYTERFSKLSVKRGGKSSKLNETTEYPKQGVSNIYLEAKKHLSEMLSNGEESAEFLSGKLPSTLGRILSLPEYNFSPIDSPRKEREHSFVTAQMRLQPGPHVINDHCDQKPPNGYPEVLCGQHHDDSVREILASSGDERCSEDILETVNVSNIGNEGDCEILEASVESSTSLISTEAQNCEVAEVVDGESHCLKLDSAEEDQLSSSPTVSPSSSSLTRKLDDSVNVIDKIERPSPISVLEPLFSEDDVSPASISRPVQSSIQPKHIQFEELSSPATNQEIRITCCMEDEESAFEYIEAVLLASDLNWDEFLLRWLSSDQPLDPSLFDEVKLFSNRPSHDQRLLFDCTNEVLKEVCNRYFGGSLRFSSVKESVRPAPRGMKLIQEVWEGIELDILQNSAQSLDQLVRKDLGKSGTWMELQSETEYIVIEMGKLILEGLMDDTFSIIVNDSMEVE